MRNCITKNAGDAVPASPDLDVKLINMNNPKHGLAQKVGTQIVMENGRLLNLSSLQSNC